MKRVEHLLGTCEVSPKAFDDIAEPDV